MGLMDNAGKGSVVEAEKVAIPEIEAAGKRLIDYAIQKLSQFRDETIQKVGKTLSGETQAAGSPTKGE